MLLNEENRPIILPECYKDQHQGEEIVTIDEEGTLDCEVYPKLLEALAEMDPKYRKYLKTLDFPVLMYDQEQPNEHLKDLIRSTFEALAPWEASEVKDGKGIQLKLDILGNSCDCKPWIRPCKKHPPLQVNLDGNMLPAVSCITKLTIASMDVQVPMRSAVQLVRRLPFVSEVTIFLEQDDDPTEETVPQKLKVETFSFDHERVAKCLFNEEYTELHVYITSALQDGLLPPGTDPGSLKGFKTHWDSKSKTLEKLSLHGHVDQDLFLPKHTCLCRGASWPFLRSFEVAMDSCYLARQEYINDVSEDEKQNKMNPLIKAWGHAMTEAQCIEDARLSFWGPGAKAETFWSLRYLAPGVAPFLENISPNHPQLLLGKENMWLPPQDVMNVLNDIGKLEHHNAPITR